MARVEDFFTALFYWLSKILFFYTLAHCSIFRGSVKYAGSTKNYCCSFAAFKAKLKNYAYEQYSGNSGKAKCGEINPF